MATNNKEFKVKHGLLVESGNVGIGTSSPSSLLHLESASSPALQIKDTTNNVTFKAYAQNSNAHVANISNHDLIIDTNNTERMRISSAGLVGIGTDSPSANLHVSSASGDCTVLIEAAQNASGSEPRLQLKGTNTSSNPIIEFGDSAAFPGSIEYENSDNSMRLGTNGSERMRINSSGNIGIGTTSPEMGIHLSTAATNYLRVTNTTTGVGSDFGTSSTGTEIINRQSAPIRFHTNTTERMRIDASGDVGIGTTSPNTTLSVVGSSANGIELGQTTSATTDSQRLFFSTSDGSNSIRSRNGALLFSTGATAGSSSGTERMRIESNGDASFQGSVNILDGSTDFTISGDSNTNTYFISNGEFRIRPLGTTTNKLVIGLNGSITTAGDVDVAGHLDGSGTGSRMSAYVQDMFHIGSENHASQINRYGNASTRTYVDGGSSGYQGYVWGQENWLPAVFIPYSPNQVYRISASIYQLTGSTATSGASSRHYLGLAGYDQNFNFLNVDNIGTYQYILASNATVSTGNFLEVDITLKGWNGSGQSDGNKMDQGTVYIRPLWLANYQSGGGTAVLTGFTIMPAGTVADNDSNAGTNY